MANVVQSTTLGSQPTPPDPVPPGLTASQLARWAWRQLTSMRTAILLLLLLMLAAIPGSIIPQHRVDRSLVARWQSNNPRLTPIFERLDLFNVYGSVWFSAIYILLMISLVGCILPRVRVYWRGISTPPPAAPKNLQRLPVAASERYETDLAAVTDRASRFLRSRHYRVRVSEEPDGSVAVAAQRGYLREAGNLVFHLSLLVVLASFAFGDLYGYRGAANIVAGETFSNDRQFYDDFTSGPLFDETQLTPFSFKMNDFTAEYISTGPQAGQPTAFRAEVEFRTSPTATPLTQEIEVNHPLIIDGTGVSLVGNGYAPIITVRDGLGNVVYSGPTVFLPEDSLYTSWGVIKAPDALPLQLGFEGRFLPTYASTPTGGPYSQFPDLLAPVLSLNAYTGDLGLDTGTPQSVYSLDKSGLTVVKDQSGQPKTLTIPLGQSVELPDEAGTISFDGVERWARLQISSAPGERYALIGVIAGLMGILASLFIRPRRLWLRARLEPRGSACEITVAGLDRREGIGLDTAVDQLLRACAPPADPTTTKASL